MHAATWAAVNGFLFLIWLITSPGGHPWFLYPAGGWGIALAIQAVGTFGGGDDDDHDALPAPPEARLAPGEDASRYRTLGR